MDSPPPPVRGWRAERKLVFEPLTAPDCTSVKAQWLQFELHPERLSDYLLTIRQETALDPPTAAEIVSLFVRKAIYLRSNTAQIKKNGPRYSVLGSETAGGGSPQYKAIPASMYQRRLKNVKALAIRTVSELGLNLEYIENNIDRLVQQQMFGEIKERCETQREEGAKDWLDTTWTEKDFAAARMQYHRWVLRQTFQEGMQKSTARHPKYRHPTYRPANLPARDKPITPIAPRTDPPNGRAMDGLEGQHSIGASSESREDDGGPDRENNNGDNEGVNVNVNVNVNVQDGEMDMEEDRWVGSEDSEMGEDDDEDEGEDIEEEETKGEDGPALTEADEQSGPLFEAIGYLIDFVGQYRAVDDPYPVWPASKLLLPVSAMCRQVAYELGKYFFIRDQFVESLPHFQELIPYIGADYNKYSKDHFPIYDKYPLVTFEWDAVEGYFRAAAVLAGQQHVLDEAKLEPTMQQQIEDCITKGQYSNMMDLLVRDLASNDLAPAYRHALSRRLKWALASDSEAQRLVKKIDMVNAVRQVIHGQAVEVPVWKTIAECANEEEKAYLLTFLLDICHKSSVKGTSDSHPMDARLQRIYLQDMVRLVLLYENLPALWKTLRSHDYGLFDQDELEVLLHVSTREEGTKSCTGDSKPEGLVFEEEAYWLTKRLQQTTSPTQLSSVIKMTSASNSPLLSHNMRGVPASYSTNSTKGFTQTLPLLNRLDNDLPNMDPKMIAEAKLALKKGKHQWACSNHEIALQLMQRAQSLVHSITGIAATALHNPMGGNARAKADHVLVSIREAKALVDCECLRVACEGIRATVIGQERPGRDPLLTYVTDAWNGKEGRPGCHNIGLEGIDPVIKELVAQTGGEILTVFMNVQMTGFVTKWPFPSTWPRESALSIHVILCQLIGLMEGPRSEHLERLGDVLLADLKRGKKRSRDDPLGQSRDQGSGTQLIERVIGWMTHREYFLLLLAVLAHVFNVTSNEDHVKIQVGRLGVQATKVTSLTLNQTQWDYLSSDMRDILLRLVVQAADGFLALYPDVSSVAMVKADACVLLHRHTCALRLYIGVAARETGMFEDVGPLGKMWLEGGSQTVGSIVDCLLATRAHMAAAVMMQLRHNEKGAVERTNVLSRMEPHFLSGTNGRYLPFFWDKATCYEVLAYMSKGAGEAQNDVLEKKLVWEREDHWLNPPEFQLARTLQLQRQFLQTLAEDLLLLDPTEG